jgi:hypothetical protein
MTSRMPFARIAILKWAVQNMTLIGSTKWPDMMKYSATIECKQHDSESRSSLCIKGLRLCWLYMLFALSAVLSMTKMTNEILAKFGKIVSPSAAMRQFL